MTATPGPRIRTRPVRIALVLLLAMLFVDRTAQAQGGGPGFLFSEPRASVGVRVGYSVPALDSDLFDFTREQFTLEAGDFRSPWIGGEVAVRVARRLDLVTELGWTRAGKSSEYREWEDTGGLPINQETTFERTSLRFGARYFLTDRGRRVGQLAWVPRRVAPFLGAGVGVTWHEFLQAGDFVDFDTLDVFRDRIRTTGTSVVSDVRGGVQISVSRRVIVTTEARYEFGAADTRGDFVGFGDTDLAGFLATVGVSFRF